MALTVRLTESLDGVGEDEVFDLDPHLGALGCHGRLTQHSVDPRWEPRYVVVRDGARLRAAVPVFLGHGTQWSDQIHSPRDWGLPVAPDPDRSALVGGRLEIRGSLRCAGDPDVVAAVADVLVPELRGRDVFLGFLGERQQRLAEAIFGPVRWLAEFEDFAYPEQVVLGSLDSLTRPVRQTIRQGERQIDAHAIKAETVRWREYRGAGPDLIAAHNRRMGMVDHSELVRYRMDQWEALPDVTVLVAHAVTSDGVEGAVTLLAYRDELEVYEIGLPDGESPARRALYACLTFHQPRRLAQAHGLTTIRAGLGSARPKRLRGAEATIRRCGVAWTP
ncbi:hypothetical protein ACWENQ_40795 [Nonomuraea sp. NPDC004354]